MVSMEGDETSFVELEKGESSKTDLGVVSEEREGREEGDVKGVGEDSKVRPVWRVPTQTNGKNISSQLLSLVELGEEVQREERKTHRTSPIQPCLQTLTKQLRFPILSSSSRP